MFAIYWKQSQVLEHYKTPAFHWLFVLQYSFSHTVIHHFPPQEASFVVQDSRWLFSECFVLVS